MDWRYGPGEAPVSLPMHQPNGETIQAYLRLLDETRLSLRNFERDRGLTLWKRLDGEVAAGRLSEAEVTLLRWDTDGAYSIPLAHRYLDSAKGVAVAKWMRSTVSFWNYNWIDTGVKGAPGRGTIRLFETLRDCGAAKEGADLAAEHLWYRLIGARYREGLRWELREWYKHYDRVQRRTNVLEHRARYGKPHRIEIVFSWLDYIAGQLRPFIEAGTEEAIDRMVRVEAELSESRANFEADLI